MSEFQYAFTVFTPTYNRAHLLRRAYESLAKQTFRDFEWLVVDDGSTDDTQSLMQELQARASFPVRCVRQANAGKCAATNRAAKQARGRFFAFLDSDDEYLPTALESLKRNWDTIPDQDKHKFSAVTGHTQDLDGNLVGTRFPHDPTDSNSLEIRFRHGVRGEKSGFHRTEVLKEFPFDTFENEISVPDSLVHHRIALKYKTRYVNEVIRVYHDTPDSWVDNVVRLRAKNCQGWLLYYHEFIASPYPLPMFERIKGYANYVRTAFHSRMRILDQLRDVPSTWLWVASFPVGLAAYVYDRCRLSNT